MCRMASFLYKKSEESGVEIAVWKLDSHSGTQEGLKLTEKMGWYEGHYTPQGEIECRTPDGVDAEAQTEIFRRYPKFNSFLKWAMKQNLDYSGTLDLRGCDLKGIKLPDSIGGSLDLRGCDLKGIKLPDSIGGSLYLRGCDLKGIKLPDSIGGSLGLYCCDLKGIKLPDSIGGWLDLRGCDLKGIKLPVNVKVYK